MYKKNMKKLFLSLTLSSILFVIGGSNSPVTEAKYNPVSRKICSLAVAPYNPNSPAITGLAADPYINFLSADSCNQFVKLYGNAYSPQPPKSEDNPLKAGTEDKNVPIIRHDHSYYNDTEQDANFYYKSFVDKFEITLRSDGFNSIDLDKIQCQTPYPTNYNTSKIAPLEDCSGTVDDLWGGTTLTKKTVGNTVVIAWDFGTTNQNGKFTGRPQIWANNGKDFDQGDFTDENNRKLEFNVHLPTKNNEKIWSTTTTSKVLLADLAIRKTNYAAHKNDGCVSNDVNNSNSGWCYMDPKTNEPTKNFLTENVFTTADHTFYWFDIGSVATVWKKFQALPNVCTELKATLDDKNPIKINGKDAYQMTVDDITFAPKNKVPNEAELKWTTDDPNGKFYQDLYMATPNLPPKKVEITKNADGSINTGTATTVYYSGKPESKIKVALDAIPADQIGSLCNASMQTPAVLECQDLLVDHPEHIYENTYSVFKAKALGTDGSDLTGKIKYWVDAGYGEFYTVAPTGVAQNKSKMVYEATPTNNTITFGVNTFKPDFTIDPKIFIAGNSNSQAAETFIDLAPKFAAGTFGIQDVSSNIQDPGKLGLAVYIKVLELPKWVTSPIPMNINPVDPSPMDSKSFNPAQFGKNSVFDFNIDTNKAIGPGQNIDIQTAGTLIETKQSLFSSLFESITVDPNTTVYFNAKKPGKGVIHVQVIGSTNPDCSRDFDIEGLCKQLTLESIPANPLVGQEITLNKVTLTDSTGKVLSSSTNTNLTTTAGGTFKTATLSNIISAKVSDFPVKTTPTKEGTVTVTMDPNDPAYSAACASSVTVSKPVAGVCTEITVKLNGNVVTQLEKNTNYVITETVNTTSKDAQKISYKINSDYGVFIDMSNPLSPVEKNEIIVDNVRAFPLILKTKNTVPAATGLIPNILQYQVVGVATGCNGALPFNNPASALECNNITLTPNGDSFDPTYTQGTTFTLGGNFKDHNGEVRVSINSSGVQGSKPTIKRADNSQSTENGYITFTSSEVKNSNNSLSFLYTKNNFGDSKIIINSKEKLDITVTAVGATNAACNASIHKEVAGDKPCEGSSCGGGGGGSSKTPPEFKKYVYAENHIKDANNVINISNKTNYVTYMLVLKTGNNIKDANIIDKKLINKQIRAINNNVPGFLQFQDMKVELIKGSSKKTLYATDGYRDNESSAGKFSEFSDENFKQIQNDKYENNLCTKDKSKDKTKGLPCIDENSINSIADRFSTTGKINFEQLNNLSSDDKIIVKYQMSYPQAYRINDEKCQKLAAEGGCGQEFDNLAHVDVSVESGSKYTVKDASAKVIAICPYVLSRQGGDVFFHDLIQTGIDVNKCYEVKSCDGPCIQPESDKDQEIEKSGQGTKTAAPLLKSPSHDVCSKSNDAGNLDGYNDVLKNFSSSICELRADVSKAWTKQNITDSINANVKRLSRFGSNLEVTTSVSSTSGLPPDPSGVYVKVGGNFTIGDGSQDYVIGNKQKDGVRPAAQTYIVIGGNLRIKSNIVYDNNLDFITTFDKSRIASAAFIVIGGNIEIDDTVDQIDGIIMAVEDSKGNGGKIVSTGDRSTDTTILNINGSLIGDVYNLFKNRQFAGNPLKDEGSVNIHYDERILLNPPAGINELINLQQVVVPN